MEWPTSKSHGSMSYMWSYTLYDWLRGAPPPPPPSLNETLLCNFILSHSRYRTGALKAGDRVLAINGESLYNKTLHEALRMLNAAGDTVSLKISKAKRKHSELGLLGRWGEGD